MQWRPRWCPKPVLWELNSFLMPTLSFVPTNLHTGHVVENALYATSTFPTMHLICPPPPSKKKNFHNFVFISSGYCGCPMRNQKQCLYKIFLGANTMRFSKGGSGVRKDCTSCSYCRSLIVFFGIREFRFLV